MDFWSIELRHGCFQGDTLEQTINKMIQYYIEADKCPTQIQEIHGYSDNEILHQVSQSEINLIQEKIESAIKNINREIKFELLYQEQIKSDYFLNLI